MHRKKNLPLGAAIKKENEKWVEGLLRKQINDTLLCVETDEHAHAGYDKRDEEIRYDDLYMVYSGKWIFIRFNPDGARGGHGR